LLQPFFQQMTAPTSASFATLVAGWILARRHHVTGALRPLAAPPKHHSAYHRVFAAARWSLDAVGLGLLKLILASFMAKDERLFLVIDDTVCRKHGRRMHGIDSHYDAANTSRKRSNANQSLKVRGHCWVILGLVFPLPFRAGHYACLPLLFRLYMNKKGCRRHGRTYRSRPELARELLQMVCAGFAQRSFHLLADSAYGGQDTLRNLPANCQMTCRWQMNVRLCQPPPQRRPDGKRGPLPRRGPLLPSPRQMLEERCPHVKLDLYGQHISCRLASTVACLYTVPQRLLRIVVTELLTAAGKPRPDFRAMYYSTATDATPEKILQWYAQRWSIEVAIRDSKQQMGFGQPQGWTAAAVERTAPTLMLLYGLVVLWFTREGQYFRRPAHLPWYPHKSAISFADMLSTLRWRMFRQSLGPNLQPLCKGEGSRKAAGAILRLIRLAA
jgi:hypothetical protein